MNPHISDELPRLLTGEATRDTVLAAAEHLRRCIDCQQELVSAVVAHASLTSAQRYAPEIVSGEAGAQLAASTPAQPTVPRRPEPTPTTAQELIPPDLSVMFAQVRAEVAAEDRSARRPSKRAYLLAAAAVVVVGGAGAGIWAVQSGGGSGTTGGHTVALRAYDAGQTGGSAKIGPGSIAIDASSLPTLTDRRYEVWLTNGARTQLQPIGWIGNDGTATLSVPDALMSKYQDLEVSVQDMDAKTYTYSGTSVLRGSLE